MKPCAAPDPDLSANLVAMLDALFERLRSGAIDGESYSRTLNYLRFKIGEELFERYATHLARAHAIRVEREESLS